MGRASFTVTIDRPPNEVFAFVADLRNLDSWYPAVAVTDTYELTPVAGGTELRYTIDVAHRGWRAPLGPLIDRAARIGLRPLGGALKRRLEPEP